MFEPNILDIFGVRNTCVLHFVANPTHLWVYFDNSPSLPKQLFKSFHFFTHTDVQNNIDGAKDGEENTGKDDLADEAV